MQESQVRFIVSTINKIYRLFSNSEIIDCRQNKDNIIEVPENNEIIDMLQNKLRLRGYSLKTIKAYLGHMRRYLKHYENELNHFEKDLVDPYCTR